MYQSYCIHGVNSKPFKAPTISSIKSLAMATVKSSRAGEAAPPALVLVAVLVLALALVAEASSCDNAPKGDVCSSMISEGVMNPVLIRECCRVLSHGSVD